MEHNKDMSNISLQSFCNSITCKSASLHYHLATIQNKTPMCIILTTTQMIEALLPCGLAHRHSRNPVNANGMYLFYISTDMILKTVQNHGDRNTTELQCRASRLKSHEWKCMYCSCPALAWSSLRRETKPSRTPSLVEHAMRVHDVLTPWVTVD